MTTIVFKTANELKRTMNLSKKAINRVRLFKKEIIFLNSTFQSETVLCDKLWNSQVEFIFFPESSNIIHTRQSVNRTINR